VISSEPVEGLLLSQLEPADNLMPTWSGLAGNDAGDGGGLGDGSLGGGEGECPSLS
jgi:hypothetical protein